MATPEAIRQAEAILQEAAHCSVDGLSTDTASLCDAFLNAPEPVGAGREITIARQTRYR